MDVPITMPPSTSAAAVFKSNSTRMLLLHLAHPLTLSVLAHAPMSPLKLERLPPHSLSATALERPSPRSRLQLSITNSSQSLSLNVVHTMSPERLFTSVVSRIHSCPSLLSDNAEWLTSSTPPAPSLQLLPLKEMASAR